MNRSTRVCWISVLFIVMLCSVSEGYASEIGLRIGSQRMGSGNEYFRFKVGMFYSIDMSDNFKLQPEVYFSTYSYDYAGLTYMGADWSRKELRYYDNLSYIEVPVLVKYRIPLAGDLRPVILAGLYAAIRLNEVTPEYTENEFYSDGEFWEGFEIGLNRDYAKVEGGVVLGIGVEHGTGKTRLSFDVRFNLGLTKLTTVYTSYPEELMYTDQVSYSKRNNSMSFNVGLSFL
ncbi:MAG: PorT family protein [bacterium]|nr:PorT family protein [bacterium]